MKVSASLKFGRWTMAQSFYSLGQGKRKQALLLAKKLWIFSHLKDTAAAACLVQKQLKFENGTFFQMRLFEVPC